MPCIPSILGTRSHPETFPESTAKICKRRKAERSSYYSFSFHCLWVCIKKKCQIIKWNKTKQIQDWGWTYWVPLIGGTKLGVLGPRTMSAFSHTGLFIGFLLCFSLSTSKDKPTESKDLKSNLMPAGETQRFNRGFSPTCRRNKRNLSHLFAKPAPRPATRPECCHCIY